VRVVAAGGQARASSRRRKVGGLESAGIGYRVVDGAAAGEDEGDLLALADEVCGGGRDPEALRRGRVRRRQPGFALVEARHGQYLVGYASGMPLRPATSWWRGLTTPLPGEVTAEYPGRTFAVTELLVRAPWRRQGIGRELHALLLGERAEERATLTVPPGAVAAQAALRSWGWRKIARTRGEHGAGPVLDLAVLSLPWAAPPGKDWWD
jgi:ribosomal protein S18 acetylase RimI-like enzyme